MLVTADHPRSRGVYETAVTRHRPQSGSSPLARGLLRPHRNLSWWFRIIPARAGFTVAVAVLMVMVPDHPRSRGVYYWTGQAGGVTVGSSPLARGLLYRRAAGEAADGIIPARAGFTLADPWNPNDEPHYQTAFAFTADLVLAPQSSDSAVVSQRSTRTPSEA